AERRSPGHHGRQDVSRQAWRRALDKRRLRALVCERRRQAGPLARDVRADSAEGRRVQVHGQLGQSRERARRLRAEGEESMAVAKMTMTDEQRKSVAL